VVDLAHARHEREVAVLLHAERAREQEVDVAAVLEDEAEVVQVAQHEGAGLHRRRLDDAVEHHPVAVALQDARGDELGAVVAAVALAHLSIGRGRGRRTEGRKREEKQR